MSAVQTPNLFWQAYLSLEKDFLNLSQYIFITDQKMSNDRKIDAQMFTCSSYITNLILHCCTEIESISKELYKRYGGTKPIDSKDLRFDSDCLRLLKEQLHTNQKIVLVTTPNFYLTQDCYKRLKPLNRAENSDSYWTRAYQSLKHYRQQSLHYGNIKTLLQAMAALYLLNIYYKDEALYAPYTQVRNLDMSLGSDIFMLIPPSLNSWLWHDNSAIKNPESPYIVKYPRHTYQKIVDMQKEDEANILEYCMKQPEMKDKIFLKQRKTDINFRNMSLIRQIHLYRLFQKIPQSLPLQERKKLFIESIEYKNPMYQYNEHAPKAKLNKANIDKEIKQAALCTATQKESSLKKDIWEDFATSSAKCEIIIDKNP